MSEDKKDSGGEDKRHPAEEAPAEETADTPPREPEGSAEPQLPKIDFATFVFSLNSAVLVHLGVMDDPGTGQASKNLPMAKQTIDLLAMLEDKTRGNLNSDEENMLKNILYDLRIRYVRETG